MGAYSYTENSVIKTLLDDVRLMISHNYKDAKVLRENKIYNDEGDAIIDIEEVEVGSENIRVWSEPSYKAFKESDGSFVEVKQWNALATISSIIKKDDVLIIEDKRFKVVNVSVYKYMNLPYKHNIKIEEIV